MDSGEESTASMAIPQLPGLILTEIIHQYLLDATLFEGLSLRHVSKFFDQETLRALFVLQLKNLRDVVKWKRVHRRMALLHLQGFLGKRTLPVEDHEAARKALLRAADHDPSEPINDTCFCYHPDQHCSSTIVGSSQPQCKAHDLMNAMICAIGPYEIFAYGQEIDDGYSGAASTDYRYWALLLSCYRNDAAKVREQIQELRTDTDFENKFASSLCDCFMVATRQNFPSLIHVLHEEVKDREDVQAKLGTFSRDYNSLIQAINLNYDAVFEALLKWKWKFEGNSWTYYRVMNRIVDRKMEESQRERLFTIMLTWTETWRDIGEMKSLLQQIGQKNNVRLMEILIQMLKSNHFFRHERGDEGSFSDSQPLDEYSRHESKPELLRMFLENRKLMLPHSTEEQDKEMRRLAFYTELHYHTTIDVARLQILVEFSPDLMEERKSLQAILCGMTMGSEGQIQNWGWLAVQIGLKTTCIEPSTGEEVVFGSILLALAVEKLDVEAVTFLIKHECELAREALTFQVYEDDPDTMARLNTVRNELARGGQPEFKERRVFETTFMPIKASVEPTPPSPQVDASKETASTVAAAIEGLDIKTQTPKHSPKDQVIIRPVFVVSKRRRRQRKIRSANGSIASRQSLQPSP